MRRVGSSTPSPRPRRCGPPREGLRMVPARGCRPSGTPRVGVPAADRPREQPARLRGRRAPLRWRLDVGPGRCRRCGTRAARAGRLADWHRSRVHLGRARRASARWVSARWVCAPALLLGGPCRLQQVLRHVVAVQHHDLVLCVDEVEDKFVLGVVERVDLSDTAQDRVRAEDEVRCSGGADDVAS